MPAYEYAALDAAGRRDKGVLEGDSPRQVRQQLRERGLTPLHVEAISGAGRGVSGRRIRRGHMDAGELALLTRQLATLLRSGAPLEEALGNIARQTRKSSVKRVVMGVRSRVVEGYSLGRALGEYPNVFSELYRATVEAGEEAGHLDPVLERLADYTESRQVMRQKVGAALIYPIMLTLVAMLVLVGLLGYVVPQVVQVFVDMGQQLPWLTQALLALSQWVQDYGLWALGGLVLLAVLWLRLLRLERFRYRVHVLLMRLPFVGNLYRGLNSARFARTLSILAGSGVSILTALEIAGRVLSSLPMRAAVRTATERVREGGLIHKALESSGQFPPMTIYLIANGEASGQLEQMLERAADQQDREADMAITTALALFEPLLIIVMGGLVLMIVLAILLPIFELNQLIT
jgi:general secretion pathway protein F